MSFRANSERSSIPRSETSRDLISDCIAELRLEDRLTGAWNSALQWFSSLLAREWMLDAFSQGRARTNGVRVHHLDQMQMLAYLDGELGPGTAEASTHLQSCWSCRSEMRVIRMQIRTFLRDRDAHLPNPPLASAERVGELRRRLIEDGH